MGTSYVESHLFNFATNRDRSERRRRKRRDNFVEATHEEDSGEGGGGLDPEGIQGSTKRYFLGCVKQIATVLLHPTESL